MPTLSKYFFPIVFLMVGCTNLEQHKWNYDQSKALKNLQKTHKEQSFNGRPLTTKQSEKISKALEDSSERKAYLDNDSYSMGYVEFDDVGSYWDIEQGNYFLKQLRLELNDNDVVCLVFAHGWKNNASSGNEKQFKKILSKVAELEKKGKGRKVVGLYIGWRGRAYEKQPFSVHKLYNWSSFWSRKDSAHAIGAGGALTQLLAAVEATINQKNEIEDNGSIDSILVTAGHSFGGAVIYGALSQLLVTRDVYAEDSRNLDQEFLLGQYSDSKGFGDLVLLINPAFEATRLDFFAEYFKERNPSDPVLIVFSSTKDFATRSLFPLGQFLGSFWKRHRPSRNWLHMVQDSDPRVLAGDTQGHRSKKAVGNYPPLVTHILHPKEDYDKTRCKKFGGNEASDSTVYGNAMLGTCRDDSPLWILETDDKIIADHSKIFGDKFLDVLVAFVTKK